MQVHRKNTRLPNSDDETTELFYRSQTSLNVNTLSVNPTKWSNTLKQFIGKLPMNCLSVFDIFGGWCLKGQKFTMFRNIVNVTMKLNLASKKYVKTKELDFRFDYVDMQGLILDPTPEQLC